MALIPPFFLDCVMAIGIQGTNGPNWIGTGFLVGRPYTNEKGEKLYNTFLVTNKHVLQGKSNILIRFNSMHGAQVKDYPVNIIDNGTPTWVGHPSQNIDVAAFYINPTVLQQDGMKFSFFNLDDHCMPTIDMKTKGVSEGDSIYVLGFPMGIVSPNNAYVISRSGSIARVRDVLENLQQNYLIDANVFPGNSGGPVIIRPESISIQGTEAIKNAALIGIVKSYVPYKDVAVSALTGNTRVIFEENSGLALVETVDSINATVEIAFTHANKAINT